VRSSTGLRVAGWVVVIASVVAGVAFAARFGVDPNAFSSALIGKPAPSFDLKRLESPESVSLEKLQAEVIVINFWASWCAGCRTEHDGLLAAATAYQIRGVRFVGINYQDDRQAAVVFLDELGRGEAYDYLIDEGSRVAISYGVRGIPETFVIDKEGVVAAVLIGPVDALRLSTIIDRVLAGERPGGHVVGTIQEGPTAPG